MGEPVQSELKDGYFCIDRRWKKGDKVAVHFDMEPRTVKANNKSGGRSWTYSRGAWPDRLLCGMAG